MPKSNSEHSVISCACKNVLSLAQSGKESSQVVGPPRRPSVDRSPVLYLSIVLYLNIKHEEKLRLKPSLRFYEAANHIEERGFA